MKRPRKAGLRSGTNDKPQQLEKIVNTLNSPAGSGEELRSLVKLWQKSGPSTARLFKEHFDLWTELGEVWKNTSGLWPTSTGEARLEFLINIGSDESLEGMGASALRTKAVVLFNALLINPLWDKLAGPCARCGNYYVKKRASQKVYCSRRCGNATTAVARTRKRIEHERKDKLLLAKAAMRDWRRTKTQEGWKQWVSIQTGIDSRFLTRAVTRGDLVAPKKGK